MQPAPIVRGETMKLGSIGDDVLGLQQALAKYGYGIPTTGKYDGPTMEAVTAFQRHFRPARVDGVADHSTLVTLQALLETLAGRSCGRRGEVAPGRFCRTIDLAQARTPRFRRQAALAA